ncbi:hypothetical protein BDV95DRAFT_577278 [Massariosphaeria phaeospora]|uniref:Uncharacterized protein n=1 Tax=Massariosphaeria phaeospora TaxID=100035 RepID=A0A7C8M3S4_9PLEO|nr:hypothetical protein BDV95DRAFT_577278 [Massariosphaeria phaeospora]
MSTAGLAADDKTLRFWLSTLREEFVRNDVGRWTTWASTMTHGPDAWWHALGIVRAGRSF